MRNKSRKEIKEYWIQVLIAFSQVTFGVAWASLFLPLDVYKVSVVLLNIVATTLLIAVGWRLKKKWT